MTSPGLSEGLHLSEARGRWVLIAMILGSAIAGIDATVVNVALPAIGREFNSGVSTLQWTLTAYLLTLSALILVGGSLGDRYGRRRIFIIGIVWFAIASAACGLAPNAAALIASRALQGVGGALMTPGSLAILQASFVREDRARAIGAWSAFAGIATAAGPLVGGYLVNAASWRWVFLLNLPLAVVVVVLTIRHVPESSDPSASGRLDLAGTAFVILGLTGVTYALVEASGSNDPTLIALIGLLGVACLVGFVIVERRSRHPMLPLDVFRSRQFVAANFVTLVVYAALGGMLFLLGVYLQTALGYSPIEAGLALFPVTIIMLLLSARSGALATRIGPRIPMTAGPVVIAAGLLLMTRIQPGAGYVTTALPAVIVFGLGLALTVAPLTSTVLAAAESRHAGVASGINNAVARTAQLLAVAVLPVLAGITGDQYRHPEAFASGFKVAAIITAALAASGGVLAWFTIRNDVLEISDDAPTDRITHCYSCGVSSPPTTEGVRH